LFIGQISNDKVFCLIYKNHILFHWWFRIPERIVEIYITKYIMMNTANQIEIYQADDSSTEIKVQFEQDTVWLTQAQMAELFETTPQNITMHLKSIDEEEELVEHATCKNFLQVRTEGIRTVKRKQLHYSLDAII